MKAAIFVLLLCGTARADTSHSAPGAGVTPAGQRSGSALAATPRQSLGDARQLAASAEAHFDIGEYDAAIADYRAAYHLVPSPGLLYDLGQSYRLAGDCPNARTMYKSYLRRAPRSRYRDLALQHLSALGNCLRVSTIEGAPPPLPAPRVDVADSESRPAPRHHRLWVGIATAVVGLAAGAAAYWYESEPALSPASPHGKMMGWSF